MSFLLEAWWGGGRGTGRTHSYDGGGLHELGFGQQGREAVCQSRCVPMAELGWEACVHLLPAFGYSLGAMMSHNQQREGRGSSIPIEQNLKVAKNSASNNTVLIDSFISMS